MPAIANPSTLVQNQDRDSNGVPILHEVLSNVKHARTASTNGQGSGPEHKVYNGLGVPVQ